MLPLLVTRRGRHRAKRIMEEKKVFRVLIGETQGFYVDTEAVSVDDAIDKVRARLRDPQDVVQPIEDNSSYEGYVVEDAREIKRQDAHLE